MIPAFKKGFEILEQEVTIEKLPINGRFPDWLAGTLVRNGPANLDFRNKKMHWFDGLAMLHSFTFHPGQVSYANKYLQTQNYQEVAQTSKLKGPGFGADPCRTIFQRVFSLFNPDIYDNANINVAQLADEFVAMTETPMPICFDLPTLKTLGTFQYEGDDIKGSTTTAHPHFDFKRKTAVNYLLEYSRLSTYHIYAIPAGQKRRQVIGNVQVSEPAYMHSFGVTEDAVILVEFPLVVNPLKLLMPNKGFIQNYEWKPERGTHFLVVNKADGTVKRWASEAFFSFHHINAFNQNGDIWLDMTAYPDTSLIDAFYTDNLMTGKPIPTAEFRRYRLPANSQTATYERLSNQTIELPRLNYKWANSQPYQYAYGTSNRADFPGDMFNQLVKVDVKNRQDKVWFEDNCYPGEPVFVAAPQGTAEDEGVLLSVVLNAEKGNSFLLALDAHSFAEIGRAEVPHHIPFGFHGQFFNS